MKYAPPKNPNVVVNPMLIDKSSCCLVCRQAYTVDDEHLHKKCAAIIELAYQMIARIGEGIPITDVRANGLRIVLNVRHDVQYEHLTSRGLRIESIGLGEG